MRKGGKVKLQHKRERIFADSSNPFGNHLIRSVYPQSLFANCRMGPLKINPLNLHNNRGLLSEAFKERFCDSSAELREIIQGNLFGGSNPSKEVSSLLGFVSFN